MHLEIAPLEQPCLNGRHIHSKLHYRSHWNLRVDSVKSLLECFNQGFQRNKCQANIPIDRPGIDAFFDQQGFARYHERYLPNKHLCQLWTEAASKRKIPHSDGDHKLIITLITLRSGANR